MSKDVFQAIYDQIVDRLMRSGFTKDELGLDREQQEPITVVLCPLHQQTASRPRLLLFLWDESTRVQPLCPRSAGIRADLREEDQKPRWFLRSTEKRQLTEDQELKLRQMKFELMSMKSDRNQPFFTFGGHA